MHGRQYKYKNVVLVFPCLSYNESYTIEVKIFFIIIHIFSTCIKNKLFRLMNSPKSVYFQNCCYHNMIPSVFFSPKIIEIFEITKIDG